MLEVYLDSCIIMYLVEGNYVLKSDLIKMLQPKGKPRPQLYYSDLARFECGVRRHGKILPIIAEQYQEFFASPGFSRISLTPSVFDLAADLRVRQKLRPIDALHLSAALMAGCDTILTNSERWREAAAGKIGIRVFSQKSEL